MASTSLDEETSKKVIRQVEFYFGDSNLPRDNFLKNTVSDSEDGMVSLALICSFTRMRGHLSLGDLKPEDVTEDTVKAVAETLRSSTFLKISEDGLKVGRRTKLPKPDELIEQLDVRTVAVSPLEHDVQRDDVEAFFAKFSEVTSVRLPRHVADKRFFCGTALVEFSTEEDAEKIMKQSFEYAGANLELKPKKDFDAEREKETQDLENSHTKEKNSPKDNYPKGLIVAFALKRASSSESAEDQNGTDKPENGVANGEEAMPISEEAAKKDEEVPVENLENKNEMESDEKGETKEEEKASEEDSPSVEEKENEKKEEKPRAASFINNKDVVMREDLKAVFQKFGTVRFIDFNMGAESGYIRFEGPEAAQKARAAAVLADQGGLAVKNFIATLEPVTGDAEKDYWALLAGNQEKHHRDFKGNRGRGGGRYSRGRKNGRSRDNGSGRPAKAQKV